MSRTLRVAVCAAVALGSSAAVAEKPPPSALEAGAFLGYGRMLAPAVDHSHELSARNGGIAASAVVLYRSPHFLSPFLEIGYAQLYASQERIDTADLGTLESDNHLSALSFAAGPALDVWRLRLRAGMGIYRVIVESAIAGVTITPAENDLGWLASAAAYPYQRPGLRIGLEARALLISEASTAVIALGVTASGDALTW